MTQEKLIKRLETTCFGLDPIDPLRLLVDDVIEALTLPEQEPVAWISPSGALYRTRYHAVANAEQLLTPLFTHSPRRTEQNFCPRCGKRTNDIHTCTPPQSTWVGLTNDELTDLFYNTNLGQQSAVAQAIALLKQKNGFAEEKNT